MNKVWIILCVVSLSLYAQKKDETIRQLTDIKDFNGKMAHKIAMSHQVLVRFIKGNDDMSVFMQQYELHLLRRLDIKTYLFETKDDVMDVMSKLKKDVNIQFVQPNYVKKKRLR